MVMAKKRKGKRGIKASVFIVEWRKELVHAVELGCHQGRKGVR